MPSPLRKNFLFRFSLGFLCNSQRPITWLLKLWGGIVKLLLRNWWWHSHKFNKLFHWTNILCQPTFFTVLMVHCTLLSLYLILVWVAFSSSCIDIVAGIRLIEEKKQKELLLELTKIWMTIWSLITINVNFVQKKALYSTWWWLRLFTEKGVEAVLCFGCPASRRGTLYN